MYRKQGYSLMETLLSMTLGFIVLAAMIAVLLIYQRSRTQLDHLLTEQEYLRFSSHILISVIETAGYIGCAGLADYFPVVSNGSSQVINSSNAVQIFSANAPDLPSFVSGNLAKDSDVIIVRRAAPINVALLLPASQDDNVSVENVLNFKANENVVIADCQHAELLQIKQVSVQGIQQRLIMSHRLQFSYPVGAQISPIEVIALYVANTHRKAAGKSIYALYERVEGQARQELIPGIQSMSVQRQAKRIQVDLQLATTIFHLVIPLRENIS